MGLAHSQTALTWDRADDSQCTWHRGCLLLVHVPGLASWLLQLPSLVISIPYPTPAFIQNPSDCLSSVLGVPAEFSGCHRWSSQSIHGAMVCFVQGALKLRRVCISSS